MSNTRKTAIVTGANGGLGRAIAEAFAGRDYNLVLSGRDRASLDAAGAAVGEPDSVLTVAGDVAAAADRHRLVEQAIGRFGRIDVLVNNAGIFEPRPFLEVDEEHFSRFLDVNLKGTFFLSQAVIPHMKDVGGGAIVNIGTVLVEHALKGVPAAAPVASKGAIHALIPACVDGDSRGGIPKGAKV